MHKKTFLKNFIPSISYLESQLESWGKWRLAQKSRHQRFRSWETDLTVIRVCQWAHSVIKAEMQLFATAQREIFLKEEIERLDKGSTGHDQKQLQKWTEELVLLDQEYWRVERILYTAEANGKRGPAKAAYLSLRKRPGWHLDSKWLREDCAKRGGCCGRKCKCCEKPPASHRIRGWGHCTSQCACCYRHRGFELTDADQKLSQPEFDLSGILGNPYSLSIFRAYIWGLE